MPQFAMQVFYERPRKSCRGYLTDIKVILCFGPKNIERFVTCDPRKPYTKYCRSDSVILTVKWSTLAEHQALASKTHLILLSNSVSKIRFPAVLPKRPTT